MGYHKHHAIVCTSWKESHMLKAHAFAVSAFAHTNAEVTPLTSAAVNGYQSFMVAPDGSKEGWDASDEADATRVVFTEWLSQSGLYVDWVQVAFGGDDQDMLTATDVEGSVRRWEGQDGWASAVDPRGDS